MAQVPDINKVQSAQNKGVATSNGDQAQKLAQDQQKQALSTRLQEVRGQAGSGPVSTELKSLIQYLEGILGEQAPDGDDYQKLEFLTQKIKEKSPQEQIDILKQVSNEFSTKEGSSLDQTIKSLKKDVLQTLKEASKHDKGTAHTLAVNKNTLGAIQVDQNNSGLDLVSNDNKFISVQNNDLKGIAKKPFEKSLGFMQNFADHQQGMFEDNAFKFTEFAGTSDKSKSAYKLMREADNFWKEEKGFLQELKGAGKSRDNNTELQAALRDLFTLEIQMGSSFDTDFANIETGKKGDSDKPDLSSKISEKKSEIKSLHSNLA
jgi:hypothetical protein